MAITCRICNKELDAGSGGRCRKCHQLVCQKCVSAQTASDGGLLCINCAAMDIIPQDIVEAIVEEKKPSVESRNPVPLWTVATFLVVLFGAFVFIAYYPAFRIKILAARIESPNEDRKSVV